MLQIRKFLVKKFLEIQSNSEIWTHFEFIDNNLAWATIYPNIINSVMSTVKDNKEIMVYNFKIPFIFDKGNAMNS